MWKSLSSAFTPIIKRVVVLQPEPIVQIPLRTTFILKRRFPPELHKKGVAPRRLKPKHYIYDLVKDTNIEKQPEIDLILTSNIDGIGRIGDRLTKGQSFAYNKLILPGLAVYATPENIEKYKEFEVKDETVFSSPTSQRVINILSRLQLCVFMNNETPWVLKAWHIKAHFLRTGINVPEETITMPEKEISGPNMDLEGKLFHVTVTINNVEKVRVWCRLQHWVTDISERPSYEIEYWKTNNGTIFPEDAALLHSQTSEQSSQNMTVS